MRETLDAARARLRQSQGAGARYDSPGAPAEKLLALRLARSACQRQVSRLGDEALQVLALALIAAEIGCVARSIAEAFESASGHQGIEGDHAGRNIDLGAEIALAKTLPGRALRALYFHALQHLDVACRDLDAQGWTTGLVVPGLGPTSPPSAIDHMAAVLGQAALSFEIYADHGRLPLPNSKPGMSS